MYLQEKKTVSENYFTLQILRQHLRQQRHFVVVNQHTVQQDHKENQSEILPHPLKKIGSKKKRKLSVKVTDIEIATYVATFWGGVSCTLRKTISFEEHQDQVLRLRAFIVTSLCDSSLQRY